MFRTNGMPRAQDAQERRTVFQVCIAIPKDERYAAGAGSPGVPVQARIGLGGAIVWVLQSITL